MIDILINDVFIYIDIDSDMTVSHKMDVINPTTGIPRKAVLNQCSPLCMNDPGLLIIRSTFIQIITTLMQIWFLTLCIHCFSGLHGIEIYRSNGSIKTGFRWSWPFHSNMVDQHCWGLLISPWKKWRPFRTRYFQMHFHEWNILYFD